jgi:hypothetical protein
MLFYSYTCSFSFLFKIKKVLSGKKREREREIYDWRSFFGRANWVVSPLGGKNFLLLFFFSFDFYTRLHTFRLRRRRPFIILNQNFVSQNGRRKTNKQKIDNVDALKRRSAGVSDVSISLKLFLLVKRRRR